MRAILVVLLMTLTTQAWGQSVDCEKASNETEETICYDREIGALDEIMHRVYWASFEHVGWLSDAQIRNTQREWLKERNNCGSEANCIYSSYSKRLYELSENVFSIDTRNNFTSYIYAGEPNGGVCTEDASMSEWGQCVYWLPGGAVFRGLSVDGLMAFSFRYVGANGHTCGLDGSARYSNDRWVFDDGHCELNITIGFNGLNLEPNEACSDYCGMRARGAIEQVFEY